MFDASEIECLREDNRLEAKAAQGGFPQSVWETYSAFANTDGGIIVLGASEDADGSLLVVGAPKPDVLVKRFWDAVNNPKKVSANILADSDVRVERVRGKEIVVIEVPRADRRSKPVYIGGNPLSGTYRRNGEGDYHCTAEEYEGMVRDASGEPMDEVAVEQVGLDGLCGESVESYRNALKAARPGHPWCELPREELLMRLGAVRRCPGDSRLRPTRAGLLMFGYEYEIVKEFPNYFLDYRETGGGRRWEDRVTSGDGEWSGGVFGFWLRVLPRLTSGLKRPFALDVNLRRVEDTDMHAAVREGLANALIHADYFGRRYVVVIKRDDRIEYANPGGLRMPAAVAMGGGVSDARNPTIMKMFGLINVCEKAGSGFDVMKRASEGAQAPSPQLHEEFAPDRTTLVLHLGNASATSQQEAVGRELHEGEARGVVGPEAACTTAAPDGHGVQTGGDEARIASLLRSRGRIRRVDVESELGIGATKAKSLLSRLVGEGIVEVEGAGRATVYRLAKESG